MDFRLFSAYSFPMEHLPEDEAGPWADATAASKEMAAHLKRMGDAQERCLKEMPELTKWVADKEGFFVRIELWVTCCQVKMRLSSDDSAVSEALEGLRQGKVGQRHLRFRHLLKRACGECLDEAKRVRAEVEKAIRYLPIAMAHHGFGKVATIKSSCCGDSSPDLDDEFPPCKRYLVDVGGDPLGDRTPLMTYTVEADREGARVGAWVSGPWALDHKELAKELIGRGRPGGWPCMKMLVMEIAGEMRDRELVAQEEKAREEAVAPLATGGVQEIEDVWLPMADNPSRMYNPRASLPRRGPKVESRDSLRSRGFTGGLAGMFRRKSRGPTHF